MAYSVTPNSNSPPDHYSIWKNGSNQNWYYFKAWRCSCLVSKIFASLASFFGIGKFVTISVPDKNGLTSSASFWAARSVENSETPACSISDYEDSFHYPNLWTVTRIGWIATIITPAAGG
jgi:hypothetical protein